MSDSNITTAFVQQYAANVELLLQQKLAIVAPLVTSGTHKGKKASIVEQFGKATAEQFTTRNSDTPNLNLSQDKRWVVPGDYHWGTLIDDQDRLRMIIDPTSPIAQAAAAGLARKKDDLIITAFFGSAVTGEDATGSEAWDTSYDVAVTVGGTASSLNSSKLKNAIKLLIQANEGELMEPVSSVISSYEHDALLKEIEIISKDYNGAGAVLQDGRVKRFMGTDFVISERLNISSGNRLIPVFVRSGMYMGVWEGMFTDITKRPDKSYATQVYCRMTMGATRTQLGKVIRVLCDDQI